MYIDSLRTSLAGRAVTDAERLDILLKLGDSYNAYRVDSALYFYGAGMKAAKAMKADSAAMRFALKTATFRPLQMFMTEAEQLMDSITAVGVPPGLLAEYYDAQRQMNNYISNIFAEHPDLHAKYRNEEFRMQQRLLGTLDKDSYQYLLNLAEHHYYSRDYASAKKY